MAIVRKGLNVSKMRQRITFLNPPTGKDADGFKNTEWTDYRTVWAASETLKGRSFYAAAQAQMQDSKEFKCRYASDLHDEMRIRHKGKEFKIESLENVDDLNIEIKIVVSEVV